MSKIATGVDEGRLFDLIGGVNASKKPIAPDSKDGRYVGSIDQDRVRDLRGLQFESEVMEAYESVVHDRLRATADDHTMLSEEEARRRLVHLTIHVLMRELDREDAALALEKAADDLRRYRSDDLGDLY